ncbi:MAG: hypothetical protein HY315_00770 [Acidobacteria bacterium]|nr:hypothetical protein [Acidobacteriota bacterium]
MGVATGVLTRDMTRLCGEIGSMRRIRADLRYELARATKERRNGVSRMQKAFFDARLGMARRTKASRQAFISGLKNAVGAIRQELRTDLGGARQAWSALSARRSAPVHGPGTPESGAQPTTSHGPAGRTEGVKAERPAKARK